MRKQGSEHRNGSGECTIWTDEEYEMVEELMSVMDLIHLINAQKRELTLQGITLKAIAESIRAKLASNGRTPPAIQLKMQALKELNK